MSLLRWVALRGLEARWSSTEKTVSRITALQNRKNRLYIALLLTGLLGVFSYGFRNDATSLDDDGLVFENPVQLSFGLPQLRDAFDPRVSRSDFGYQFTPLSDLSYAIDRKLFGASPQPYHLQGALFHAIAACALFSLLIRLGASSEAALAAGAIFVLHPLQVEPVTWISGRRTAMAGAFMLLAMLAWHDARIARSKAAYALSIVFAVAANLSKQSAVITCVLLAITEWIARRTPVDPLAGESDARRESPASLWLAYAPHVCISLVFIGIGIWVGWREQVIEPQSMALGTRLRLTFWSIDHYARSLVWPAGLKPSYRVSVPSAWTNRGVVEGLAVIAAAAAALLFYVRRAPLAAFGILVAGVAILPGAHGIGSQLVADRYMYLTIAGAAIVVAAASDLSARRAPALVAILVVALVATLSVSSYARVGAWRDDLTICRDAAQKDPDDPIWRRMLGKALVRQGRYEEGELELRRAAALSLAPLFRGTSNLPFILIEIGLVREMRLDDREAEVAMRSALAEAGPGQIDTSAAALAAFYVRHRRPEKAIEVCRGLERDRQRADRCRAALHVR